MPLPTSTKNERKTNDERVEWGRWGASAGRTFGGFEAGYEVEDFVVLLCATCGGQGHNPLHPAKELTFVHLVG